MGGIGVRMPRRRHVEVDNPSDETLHRDYYLREEDRQNSPSDVARVPTTVH
ncbi:unnamed protein product, partial [Rotaria magnacalcarata]